MDLNELESRIEREYGASGYPWGWRLLASPKNVLSSSDIAFIGLNPGGAYIDPAHAKFAPDRSSAYVTECWGYAAGESPLQRQVRALFHNLEVAPEKVLAGNLVPFRSPSWSALPEKRRALAFGKALWSDILSDRKHHTIITMGGVVFASLCEILQVDNFKSVPAGWGNISIRFGETDNTRLVGLPHLSRFPLIGRVASEPGLAEAFGDKWKCSI